LAVLAWACFDFWQSNKPLQHNGLNPFGSFGSVFLDKNLLFIPFKQLKTSLKSGWGKNWGKAYKRGISQQ